MDKGAEREKQDLTRPVNKFGGGGGDSGLDAPISPWFFEYYLPRQHIPLDHTTGTTTPVVEREEKKPS